MPGGSFQPLPTDRFFSDKSLTPAELSAVLWAAGGKRHDAVTGAGRTYPSAHALYPLAFYAVAGTVEGIEPGIYQHLQHLSDDHALKLMKPGDRRKELAEGNP